jgi:3-hydroxyisobutyrate dehydrogenase
MSKIAFLGLGAMGSRMALNLVKAGFSVTVWNRNAEKAAQIGHAGGRIAGSPRAAAKGADFVFSMVTDDHAARAVWLDPLTGAVDGLKRGAVAIESSTVSPDWVRQLGEAVAMAGARLLDAPVAGSRPQAEAGQLIFMVGGDVDTLDAARTALAPLAAKIVHAGPIGQGALLKLAVNTLFASQLESVAELLGFLGRNGFRHLQAAELLAEFPIVAPPIAAAAKMMASGNTTPLFTIDLIEKDLGYVLDAAEASQSSLPGAKAARTAFRQAQALGLGQANVSGLAAVFSQAATGVKAGEKPRGSAKI